jgi:ATP-binding cassette subfamily F protein 3
MALGVEDLSIGYVEKIVASKINFDITRGERIAVVGDNGQGKTTFLKTIAGELEALKGKFNWGTNIRFSYYAQHTPATLNSSSLVKEYLLASAPKDINHKDIYEMAGNFLFKDSALDKEISVLSGGEKARLCLASILLQKNHVLLLDEPTNHLDFETVEALAQALSQSNITVIFVSHNRTFVETLANGIVEVKNGQAARYHHNYEDYVYHIQIAIEQDLAEQSGKKSSPSSASATLDQTPNDPEETRLKLKKLKNKIYKIDTTIKKLSEEKRHFTCLVRSSPH